MWPFLVFSPVIFLLSFRHVAATDNEETMNSDNRLGDVAFSRPLVSATTESLLNHINDERLHSNCDGVPCRRSLPFPDAQPKSGTSRPRATDDDATSLVLQATGALSNAVPSIFHT